MAAMTSLSSPPVMRRFCCVKVSHRSPGWLAALLLLAVLLPLFLQLPIVYAAPGSLTPTRLTYIDRFQPSPNSPVRVIVQLKDEPLAVAVSRAASFVSPLGESDTSALRAQAARLVDGRQQLWQQIEQQIEQQGRQVTLNREYSFLLNGFALTINEADQEWLEGLPQVKAVYPDLEVEAALDESVLQIGTPTVWEMRDRHGLPVTGSGISMAIIDTGIDYTHPDLGGCLGPGCRVAGGYDFVNQDGDPTDDHGHGTHVAGIAAANGGMRGVAPDANLVAYKVLNVLGKGYQSNVIAALEMAVNPDGNPITPDGAQVINLSLGNSLAHPDDPQAQAADLAAQLGAVVVAAAGNRGPAQDTIYSPAIARQAIAVGSVSKTDQLSEFSSRGFTYPVRMIKPEILAPGEAILSTALGGGYEQKSGTSMATPHVAGAAALLRQLYPEWTVEQVKGALVNTSRDLGYQMFAQGNGRLDVAEAANAKFLATPATLSFGQVSVQSESVTVLSSITLKNKADTPIEVSLIYERIDNNELSPPAQYLTLERQSLSIPANASSTVGVTLNISPSASEGYHLGRIIAQGGGTKVTVPVITHVSHEVELSVYSGAAGFLEISKCATRLTPPAYPAYLRKVVLYVKSQPLAVRDGVRIFIQDEDHRDLLVEPVTLSETAWNDPRWVEIDLSALNITIPQGSFYVYLEGFPVQESSGTGIGAASSRSGATYRKTDQGNWEVMNDVFLVATVSSTPATQIGDFKSPALTVLHPKDGFIAQGILPVDVKARDTSGIREVLFYVDNIFHSVDLEAPYTTNLDTQSMYDGRHTLSVVAVDNMRHFKFLSRLFYVQNSPPLQLFTAAGLDSPAIPGSMNQWLAKGDIDQDGRDEIFVMKRLDVTGQYQMQVFQHDGSGFSSLGSFVYHGSIETASPKLAVGNVDADPQIEIVIAGANDLGANNAGGDYFVDIYQYDDAGGFFLEYHQEWRPAQARAVASDIALGDVTGDGGDEIVLGGWGNISVLHFEDGEFKPQVLVLHSSWDSSPTLHTTTVGDYDGDGMAEIIDHQNSAGCPFGLAVAKWNAATGQFEVIDSKFLDNQFSWGRLAADLDGDTDDLSDEFILGDYSGYVSIYKRKSEGYTLVWQGQMGPRASSMAADDVDKDGRLDVVVQTGAFRLGGKLHFIGLTTDDFWELKGSREFKQGVGTESPEDRYGLLVSDFDGDGEPEFGTSMSDESLLSRIYLYQIVPFSLSAATYSGQAMDGLAYFEITMSNTSALLETYFLSIDPSSSLPAGWSAKVEPDIIQLDPYSTQNVRLIIEHPASTLATSVGMVVIKAVLTAKPEVSATLRTATFVPPRYSVMLRAGVNRSQLYQAIRTILPLEVENTGNITSTFTLSLHPQNWPSGWLALVDNQPDSLELTLDPGQSFMLTLQVIIPEGAPYGLTGLLELSVVSQDNAEASDTLRLTFTVEAPIIYLPIIRK